MSTNVKQDDKLQYSQGHLVNVMGFPLARLTGCSVEFAEELGRRYTCHHELVVALRNCITWMDLSDPDGEQAKRDFERILAKAEA